MITVDYCKVCGKFIGNMYPFTKKPYCSQGCEDKDQNKVPEIFNKIFK